MQVTQIPGPALRICFLLILLATLNLSKSGFPENNGMPWQEGEFVEIEMPDTLDLAARMELCREPLLKWAEDKESDFAEGGANAVWSPNRACCGPKFLEGLAYLRVMTGDTTDLEREQAAIKGFEEDLGKHNLFYVEPLGPIQEKWANIFGQGRLMLAWMALYQRDGDPHYLELLNSLAEGMEDIARSKGDYMYYPTELIENAYYIFAYRESGWKRTEEPLAFHAMEEGQRPTMCDRWGHQFDARMGIPAYVGTAFRPLPLWYRMNGDEEILDFAGRLKEFLMKPTLWGAYGVPPELNSSENGHYSGHIHARTLLLRGLLDYAQVTGDTELKRFVRDSYEYTRNFGISQIGWIPEWTCNNVAEGCEIADMIALGIRLSDYGVGDYWDDVDRWVRNQLVENQHIEGPPANIGMFNAGAMPSWMRHNGIACCCTGNCSQALYFAWESITRFEEGHAHVNLLLNRVSPWLNVLSHLPYEGKVVLQNKKAKSISVRIPLWVDRDSVQVKIGNQRAPSSWAGNYLVLNGLQGSEEITIAFPMARYKIIFPPMTGQGEAVGIPFEIEFKGNTVVDVKPEYEYWNKPGTEDTIIRLYERDHYLSDEAPIETKKMYVTGNLIEW